VLGVGTGFTPPPLPPHPPSPFSPESLDSAICDQSARSRTRGGKEANGRSLVQELAAIRAPPLSISFDSGNFSLFFFVVPFCSAYFLVCASFCVPAERVEGRIRETRERKENGGATFSVSVGLLTRDGCGELLLSLPFLLLFPLIISSDERKKKNEIFCFSFNRNRLSSIENPTKIPHFICIVIGWFRSGKIKIKSDWRSSKCDKCSFLM
jgi:hypothetical protein